MSMMTWLAVLLLNMVWLRIQSDVMNVCGQTCKTQTGEN